MQLVTVKIEKSDDTNFILDQSPPKENSDGAYKHFGRG